MPPTAANLKRSTALARSQNESAFDDKVSMVMEEFAKGKLRTSAGRKVTSRKQAIAIALSEARRRAHG